MEIHELAKSYHFTKEKRDEKNRVINYEHPRKLKDLESKAYDDPVGIYAPSIGFVFFRYGKACAHLDVAMAYDKIQLEIFNRSGSSFKYKRELLGEKTDGFLTVLIKKYKLPKWVLTE